MLCLEMSGSARSCVACTAGTPTLSLLESPGREHLAVEQFTPEGIPDQKLLLELGGIVEDNAVV